MRATVADEGGAPDRGRWRWAEDALHVVVATGFAVTHPLLDLLGRNPTFFVAHASNRRDIVVLAALAVLAVPAVVLSAELALGLISRRARDLFHVVAVGSLVALAVAPPVYRALGASTAAALLLLVVATVGATLLYARFAPARLLLTYAGPAPLAFVALFLFASPVRHLVLPSSPEAYAAVARTETPIVFVTFDEMSLFGLLDADGEIDAERFPNMARLAGTSTWYPNATTVHEHSSVAITSLLSGVIPAHRVTPVAADHPDTIFSLLGSSYHLDAHESVTELCPSSLCERARPPRRVGALLEDSAIAFLHTVFPEGAANRLLPAIDEQWAGFREDAPPPADAAPAGGHDPAPERDGDDEPNKVDRFRSFVDSIDRTGERSTLWYHHTLLPHRPWHYLPDGSVYAWDHLVDLVTEDRRRWVDDQNAADSGLQQYLLQARFVDSLLGELLDRLESEGVLDRALLIVTADHGISFQAGRSHRFVAEDAPPGDVIPVPLFVKLPRQTDAAVDERNVEAVDILPTIAEVVGVDLPFATDGVSLLGDPPDRSATRVRWEDEILEYPVSFLDEVEARAREVERLLGPGGGRFDLFGNGAHRAIVGQRVEDLGAAPHAPGSAELDEPGLPALRVTGSVPGMSPGTSVAVAADGVVAGVAPSFVNRRGEERFVVFVHPELAAGAKTVTVHAVDGPASDPTLTLLAEGAARP